MKSNSKLKVALYFTKYSVILLRCCPPRNPSKLQYFIFELSWWLMFASSLCLLFPLIAAVYIYRNNSEIMTKSICLSCAVSQCVVKTLFCRIRRTKLQKLLEEMEDFIDKPSELDRKILEKYISQCTVLHVGVVIWVYLTSISFIIGPFLIPQPFPTDAVYPFPVDNIFIRILIYCHQSLVGLQTSAAVLLDCLVAVLLWFVCARFEALAISIGKYKSFDGIKIHIEHYQRLLQYTNDLKKTIDLFVFATILTSVGGVLFSAIQFVVDQPLVIKGQYAVVAVTASVGLFICSWAADTLLQLGYLIGINMFQSNWYTMEKKSKICIMHLIAQSQHPITMKANSILPALSLQFFSQLIHWLYIEVKHFTFYVDFRTVDSNRTMKFRVTPEAALLFTKTSIMLTAIWPPDRNANKLKLKLINIVWCFATTSPVFFLLPLLVSIYVYSDDPVILSKSICLSCATFTVIVKSVICRVHRKKLQFLLEEVDHFLKTASESEINLLQKYVNENSNFHLVLTICCYGASLGVLCGPLFSPYPLPSEAVYPFSVNTSPMWELTYIHQASVGLQAAASMCVDCLIAFLLWFTGMRFELLYFKFKYARTQKDIVHCIIEHQYLLRYGKELSDSFRYVTFITVSTVTIGLAFAGIYLFSPQPIFVKGQFLTVCVSAGINLYVTALPADNLIIMCRRIADVVFESRWIEDGSDITGSWINIIQRAHKPIVISIPGAINQLSLEFYFSMLSHTFSYFTALHVILTG